MTTFRSHLHNPRLSPSLKIPNLIHLQTPFSSLCDDTYRFQALGPGSFAWPLFRGSMKNGYSLISQAPALFPPLQRHHIQKLVISGHAAGKGYGHTHYPEEEIEA